MANKDYIVFDFETGGRDPEICQPTQIAALALDGRTFRLKGTFNSEIKPVSFDEEPVYKDKEKTEILWGPLEDEALKITGKTKEGLANAPTLETVWPKFVKFVEKYNWNKSSWFAPIPAGYNIINYDMPIIKKLCKMFGPWDEVRGQQKLFNPIMKVDMMDNMFVWTEGDPSIKSISMDNVRKRMGLSGENAHDALQDVKDTANIMIKFMMTHRAVYKKMEIDDAFANGGLYVE